MVEARNDCFYGKSWFVRDPLCSIDNEFVKTVLEEAQKCHALLRCSLRLACRRANNAVVLLRSNNRHFL